MDINALHIIYSCRIYFNGIKHYLGTSCGPQVWEMRMVGYDAMHDIIFFGYIQTYDGFLIN